MYNKSKSFGLIETLVACGILVMVSAATTGLGIMAIHGTVVAKHKTEAYNIAQDAMEKIKGGRDWVWNNWSEANGITWANFWAGTAAMSNDFTDTEADLESNCVFISHDTGVLTEAACTSTNLGLRFTRTISRSDVSISGVGANNAYKVAVTVSWSDYGQPYSVSVTSYLTNWKLRY